MGYASYLEDIHERLSRDLVSFRRIVEAPDTSGLEAKRKAQSLLNACEGVLKEIERLQELVKDPRFDLAYEVTQLDEERRELEAEISQLKLKRDRALAHAHRLEGESKGLRRKVRRLERESAQKDEQYEKLLRTNPDAAYELYSSEDQIKKGKRNA